MDIYSQLGYQAVCVGARDLSNGIDFLKKYAQKRSGLSLLSVNVYQNGQRAFSPYKVFRVSGLKLAVIGITLPMSTRGLRTRNLLIKDPEKELEKLLPQIRQQADLVILLSNLGIMNDRRILSKIHGIDIVIGSGPGYKLFSPMKIGKCLVLRTHIKGKSVGMAKVTYNPKWKKILIKNTLVLLDETKPASPEVKQKLKDLVKGLL